MRSRWRHPLILALLLTPACAGQQSKAKKVSEPRWEMRDEAESLMDLGWFLVDRKKYVDAEPLAARALELTLADQDSVGILRSRDLMGTVALSRGNYQSAVDFLTPGLELAELEVGRESRIVANYHQRLGLAYSGLGDLESALKSYQKSIEIRRAAEQPRDRETSLTYLQLGAVYQELGNYENAQLMYQRSLEIETTLVGEQLASRTEAMQRIHSLCEDGHRPACPSR